MPPTKEKIRAQKKKEPEEKKLFPRAQRFHSALGIDNRSGCRIRFQPL